MIIIFYLLSDVINSKKWYQLVEQDQGYLINVNFFCFAYAGKPQGEFPSRNPVPFYRGGV